MPYIYGIVRQKMEIEQPHSVRQQNAIHVDLGGTLKYHKLAMREVGALRGRAAIFFMPMCAKYVCRSRSWS